MCIRIPSTQLICFSNTPYTFPYTYVSNVLIPNNIFLFLPHYVSYLHWTYLPSTSWVKHCLHTDNYVSSMIIGYNYTYDHNSTPKPSMIMFSSILAQLSGYNSVTVALCVYTWHIQYATFKLTKCNSLSVMSAPSILCITTCTCLCMFNLLYYVSCGVTTVFFPPILSPSTANLLQSSSEPNISYQPI